MNQGTWRVTGTLIYMSENPGQKVAELHIGVDDGTIVLFMPVLTKESLPNPLVEMAKGFIGKPVTATGIFKPHPEFKIRTPHFLSPSTIIAA